MMHVTRLCTLSGVKVWLMNCKPMFHRQIWNVQEVIPLQFNDVVDDAKLYTWEQEENDDEDEQMGAKVR